MNVMIFGVQKDSDTRKALRFFKERRIKVHFNDFKVRAPSKGELRRFQQRYGMEALLNRDSKRFQSLGLGAAHYSEDRWLELATEEPEILRMPLVRCDGKVSIGHDEATWRSWTGR